MIMRSLIVSMSLLGGAAYLSSASRSEVIALRESLTTFPMEIAGWSGRRAPGFDPDVLAVLGVDEYVNAVYTDPDRRTIGLYVGYYQSQREGDTIHSPANCLPGAGWVPETSDRMRLRVQDLDQLPAHAPPQLRDIEINRYVIRKGADRQLVLYWYQSHGRVIASEYWGKVFLVTDAIRLNRTDAALVRVIAPIADGEEMAELNAERRAVAFVTAVFPLLGRYLPS